MGEMSQNSSQNSIGIDLSQFYQVFFEEAGENIESMEKLLLGLAIESADDEQLNAIFRCAHSVKGGAATFGFADVAELTHQMEALLDKLRRRELDPTAAMVDVLLASGDVLKAQLARHQGHAAEPVDTRELLASIRAMIAGDRATSLNCAAAATPVSVTPAPPAQPVRALELTVGPLSDLRAAENLVELFQEITDLGSIEPLDAGQEADGMRRFKLVTTSSDEDLIDLFSFHVDRNQVRLTPLGDGYGFHEGAPGAPSSGAETVDPGYGFFDDAPGAPAVAIAIPAIKVAPAARPEKAAAAPESSTLRVSVEKVDQLINLMGELVITQAMLAQNSKDADSALHQRLSSGLADLERNTRDLQEAVMGIRMIPIGLVFSRFPRMLRDLAGKLGKRVDLVQVGESTELDKGMVEKITDPLTHLVRNSCDHGIEMPAERLAKGKPEQGTVTLIASHQGSSIVIEVRDDGKGLQRGKLLAKARERGIELSDSMSDSEVYGLIFAPGFSTADQVTDVSGRGVGMDVVKKNITALGGTVEIDSAEGYGMTVRVRLPLTLAIMDGMSVGVGPESYILPLSSVIESIQVRPGLIKTMGGSGRVVEVRGEYMPVLSLESIFEVDQHDTQSTGGILVVVEAEEGRVALLVDELLGQQQVVVKNLESNYRKVNDVSGATIMGNGRVALILDIGSLVRRSRHRPCSALIPREPQT